MPLGRITVNPTRSVSWRLDFFWVLTPLTIACGIWDLGGWATLAFYSAVGVNVLLGAVTIARFLGYIIAIDAGKERLYSSIKGAVWAAAMVFAWPDTGLGHVYLILIVLNFCLLEFRRSKKG